MGKTPKGLASERSRPYNYRRNQPGQNSDSVSQRYLPESYSYSSTDYVPRRISPYQRSHQYRSLRFANQSYAFGVTQGYRHRTRQAYTSRGGSQPVNKRIPKQRRVKKQIMQPQVESDQQKKAIEESSKEVTKQDIAIENGTSSTEGLEQVIDSVDNHDEGCPPDIEEKNCDGVSEDVEESKTPALKPKVSTKEKKPSKIKTNLKLKRESKKFNNDESSSHVQNSETTSVEEVVTLESSDGDTKLDNAKECEKPEENIESLKSDDSVINHDMLLGNKTLRLVLPQIEINTETIIVGEEPLVIPTQESEGEVEDLEKLSLSVSSLESFKSTLSPQIKDSSRSARFVTGKSDSSGILLESDDSKIEVNQTASPNESDKTYESFSSLKDPSFGNSIRAISSRRPIRDSYSNYVSPTIFKRSGNSPFRNVTTVTSPKEDQEPNRHVSRISHDSSSLFEVVIKDSEDVDISNHSDDCSGISEASNISTDPPSEAVISSSYRKRKADILENKPELKKLKAHQYPTDVTARSAGFLSMMSPLYLFKNKVRNETIISSSTQLETIEHAVTVEETDESLIIDGEFQDISTQNIQQKEFLSPFLREGSKPGISGHRKWCVLM